MPNPRSRREKQAASRRAVEQEMERRRQAQRERYWAVAGRVIVGLVVVGVAVGVIAFFVTRIGSSGQPVTATGSTATGSTDTTAASADSTSSTTTTAPIITPTVTSCDQATSQQDGKPVFPTGPVMMIDPSATYLARIATTSGTITAQLSPTVAPLAVNNFAFLAGCGYYDNTPVGVVISDTLFAAGDPSGTGQGGPGYRIPDELPAQGGYAVGSLAMVGQGPDSASSEFFIVTGPGGAQFPANYTAFGQVTDGLAIADAIAHAPADPGGRPEQTVTITSVTVDKK